MKLFKKEVTDETILEEVCQCLRQIGIEAVPIAQSGADDTWVKNGDPFRGTNLIGNLNIKEKNLDAIQIYAYREETGAGMHGLSSAHRYSIDYLVRVDTEKMGEDRFKKLKIFTDIKWRVISKGFLGIGRRKELEDVEWSAEHIWRELAESLNNDRTVKSAVLEELKEPWSSKGEWGEISCTGGMDIAADVKNSCIRIWLARQVPVKKAIPSLLPSSQLMQSLDRIAYHIKETVTPTTS